MGFAYGCELLSDRCGCATRGLIFGDTSSSPRHSCPTASALADCFALAEFSCRPDDDGTLFVGLHLHITDALGDGLLLEATRDGGWATYDTREHTGHFLFAAGRN